MLPAYGVRLFAGKMLLELDNDDSCVCVLRFVNTSVIVVKQQLICLISFCLRMMIIMSCCS